MTNRDRPLIPVAALDRRAFLKAAGVGAAALALPACSAGPDGYAYSDDAGDAPPDLGPAAPPDLNPGCKGQFSTAHTPAMVPVGGAIFFADQTMFLCRDAGGLYALTSTCPHAGCDVLARVNAFRCPCHGAVFDFNGNVTRGPADSPLDHYALCLRGDGTITIDLNTVVDAKTRLRA